MGATLGVGSYGTVKKCLDQNTGKSYAVKIIPKSRFVGSLTKMCQDQQQNQ